MIYEKYILPALVWIASYFAPTFEAVMIVGLLVVCDMVTALVAARKSGEAITSTKLSRTVGKFAVYGVAIVVAHVICRHFLPSFPGLQLVAGFIAFVEVKSIDENIKKYTGFSLFAVILEKLKAKR